ncbi:UNVERIFIED_CONTAM: hypothetical protein FKN15_069787 [Acipenser sinensis]
MEVKPSRCLLTNTLTQVNPVNFLSLRLSRVSYVPGLNNPPHSTYSADIQSIQRKQEGLRELECYIVTRFEWNEESTESQHLGIFQTSSKPGRMGFNPFLGYTCEMTSDGLRAACI